LQLMLSVENNGLAVNCRNPTLKIKESFDLIGAS
jgi:hypothetical protein